MTGYYNIGEIDEFLLALLKISKKLAPLGFLLEVTKLEGSSPTYKIEVEDSKDIADPNVVVADFIAYTFDRDIYIPLEHVEGYLEFVELFTSQESPFEEGGREFFKADKVITNSQKNFEDTSPLVELIKLT